MPQFGQCYCLNILCTFKYNIQRYFEMFSALERYIPTLESYLLQESDNHRRTFIDQRQDPTEKILLEILAEPLTDLPSFRQKLSKSGLDYNLRNAITDYKLLHCAQKTTLSKNSDIFLQLSKKYSTGSYDFSRPTALITQQAEQGQMNQGNSLLQVENSLEKYLQEKVRQRQDVIRSFSDYAVSKLSQKTLKGLSVSNKEYLLEKSAIIFNFNPEFMSTFLALFQKQKQVSNKNYKLTTQILSTLTKNQLFKLGEQSKDMFSNEDYVSLWFNQKYAQTIRKHAQNSQFFTKLQQNQKRAVLNTIISQLDHFNQHFIIRKYQNKLKEEILILDIIVNDPSLQKLVQYLQNSVNLSRLRNISEEFAVRTRERMRKQTGNNTPPTIRYRLEVDKINIENSLEEYIELLLKNAVDPKTVVATLSKFFEPNYLRRLQVKSRLFKGQSVQNALDYFSQQQFQALRQKRQIRILPSNPKKFKIEDDVSLQLSLKNIRSINIKIYILNLEKHMLCNENSYNMDDEVELSFLKPSEVQTIDISSANPFEVISKTIDLSKLIPKKMGVYIVDIQGENVTSRAVIRKGTILCVDKHTEAGQEFSFFDQSGRPLTAEDGLKVWVKGRPAELTTNKTFVAYGEEKDFARIIASVGDFAENFHKSFEAEKYNFNVSYLYSAESFVVGRKAKVVLHGRLSMNDKQMSLQLLRNIKVKVIVTNFQHIKTAYSFDIAKWTDNSDPIIEFPIQSYIRSVNIEVSSQITLLSKKEISLVSSKDIQIELGENSSNFLDFYLDRDSKGSYRVTLLGANGEPVSNADVIIGYNVIGVDEAEKKEAKTDAHGRIHLGQLSIVRVLSAEFNNQIRVHRSWTIDQSVQGLNYNSTIYFKIGREFSLPIIPQWKSGDILFLRTFDRYYSQNLTPKVRFQGSRLVLPPIEEEGYYIIKILPIDKTIELVTLKNNQWEADTAENQKVYDEQSGTIYEVNKNLYQNISIKNVESSQTEQHKTVKVTLSLAEVPQQKRKHIRVHVYATNFVSPDYYNAFQANSLNIESKLKEHYFQPKHTAFYNNKTLSEQGAYVWNRQQKKQTFIGNSLQKPSIFLKKMLVRETTIKNENLQSEGGYIEECAIMEVDPNIRERFSKKKGLDQKSSSIQSSLGLSSHNNFLLLTGEVQTNLNDETITVNVPHGYSAIEVYVLTPKTAIKGVYPLQSQAKKETRDLRHIGLESTNENTGWTMSREVYSLKPGQKQLVSRDSQWRTVGLSEIFDFASTKRVKLYDWSNDLLSWQSYTDDKKREVYDKQCCHELNTFIYFKDPVFFSKVVGPFIKNKLQKTIVDLCLLKDASIITYTKVDLLKKLNYFQKALLVYSLTQMNQIDIASSIADSMQNQQKAIKRNFQQFKVSFDTIINAKESAQKQQLKKKKMKMQAQPEMMMLKRSAPKRQSASRPRQEAMMDMMSFQCEQRSYQPQSYIERRQAVMQRKKQFVPIQSTKEYTQKTYYNVKNYKEEAPRIVSPSPFWKQLARSFINKESSILSQSFMNLENAVQFMLAACFVSGENSSNFDLDVENDRYAVTAKAPMLMYVKEVKKVDHAKKFGVLINQRFFDPSNRKAYEEDGTEYDKEVEEFIYRKAYALQTVVNNTSGTPLELQLLLDIPRGSIPLCSHEYTQITNITLEPFSSQSFERLFYFPEEGTYEVYPSNAARGSTIIAKGSPVPPVIVKKTYTTNKLESFEDVLRSGDKVQVLNYIEKRNIFDTNVFRPRQILWMLKDADFYHKVMAVMRKRCFFDREVWGFGFLHGDSAAVRQIVAMSDSYALFPTVFEYFPYYSNRAHQFANEAKSTIRNVQLKETYTKFLIGSAVGLRQSDFEVAFAYFLILQDRFKEAQALIKSLSSSQYAEHQLQFDYMRCFLELSLKTVGFDQAREILEKYKEYPIETWRKLFDAVRDTIETEDQEFVAGIQGATVQTFQTKVIEEGAQFRVIQPADTQITVQFFEINLEKYFSEYPFYEYRTFTSIRPSTSKVFLASPESREIIINRKQYPQLTDVTVDVIELKKGLPPRKVSTFWWGSSEVKVKINEDQGTLQVYVGNKRCPGAYVKVFSDKSLERKFYRDGYTDITGSFRYAMSDIDGVKEFAILVSTEKGGSTHKVKPPSKLSSF